MSHYVFSFICNVCNVWIYIKKKRNKKKKKKPEKWGKGVNCEEEMREKKKKK
jgi:hypothetical protein